ncbi:MAG: aspartyl protease [Scytonematopsis contorta HA4267-MV1]|jgi:predicted aspartyl protease|nr:aspartyl protease [Scytonematopsis contorta HA4267-MV1]
MIHGTFGDKGELFFELDLIAGDGLNLPVDGMFDTGFTGFMAMNKQDLDGLDWSFVQKQKLRTAQGEKTFFIYSGKISLSGQIYEIPVFAGNDLTEVLLGSEWLKILPLVANFQEGVLTLG